MKYIVSICMVLIFIAGIIIAGGDWGDQSPIEPEYKGRPVVQVPLLEKGPKLDGKFDDEFWKKAGKLSQFKTIAGSWRKVVLPRTDGYIATTKDTLYMGFRCHEADMKGLDGPERKRDSGQVWDDDNLEIFIRSEDNPDRPYHQFSINASGSIDDAYKRKAVWDAKGIKTAAGEEKGAWIMEIAFPFSDLHLPKDRSKASVWRIDIFRMRVMHKGDKGSGGVEKVDVHGNLYYEETVWAPVETGNSQFPARYGYAFMEVFGGRVPKEVMKDFEKRKALRSNQ